MTDATWYSPQKLCCVQEHDAVLRFNKLNQMNCGEKTTHWLARYAYEAADKYHGLGEPCACVCL